MGITISNKIITPATIQCDELAQVTLTLTAAPDITTNPVDIMLVLDRSGSMDGDPLVALKAAAIEFIDIIREATNPGNPAATTIGTPSRIGIVSFANNATLDRALTNDVAALNAAINALTADGLTNHQAAFDLAAASYTPVLIPPNKKIMIMFTDGDTTTGGNASVAAANARAAGIEIYAIGLGNGINTTNLNNWATDPDNTHVIVAPTPAQLEQAFKDLAANISKPGAVGIEVVDTVEDEFEIVGTPVLVNPPTTIANAVIDPTGKKITWTLDELGVATTEAATVTFSVRYLNNDSATLPLNKSVVYTDQSIPTNQANFNPNITEITINCECSINIIPDCCESPNEVIFDECDTVVELDFPNATDAYDLKCNGRLLVLGVRLKNICPGRRIALGLIATEIIAGVEYSRGFKAMTVPAVVAPLPCPSCVEVIVKPITFVFPEDVDDTPDVCDVRRFNVRVIAHYMDFGLTNFNICPVTPIP